jgi:Na+:H+ antiporter, NhaC family
MEKTKQTPSFGYAALVLIISFGIIMIPAVFLGAKTQPMFLVSWLVTIPLCMKLGYTYKELQKGMLNFIARSLVPMCIVLCVGAMVGLWNASGTVAAVTRICLEIINPKYFMVISFFICLVFSLFTGTSFGTCGTIGVAMMGVGLSLGLDAKVVAAPILTAAFFGDAFSPLSDSTNVSAGAAGVDLFRSIKYQATITVPAIIVCAVIYFIWGTKYATAGADLHEIQGVITDIAVCFKLGVVPLLPLLIVLVLLIIKVPSIPSILSGAVSGFLVAWLYQGYTFKETALYMWQGFSLTSDSAFLTKIFSRGGITSMNGTAFMFVFAFGLFGLLSTAGIIDKIIEPITKRMTGRLSASLWTIIFGTIANATSASCNFSFIFTGSLLKPVYEANHLNKYDLTRSMTVGCLLTGLWVPWNTNPLTTCGFLGVEVMDMIPFMIAPAVTFAFLLLFTVTNLDKKFSKIARGETPEEEE